MSLNKKNQGFTLISKIFKDDFIIIKNNFVIVTGVNGIGKSYFLNQIKNNAKESKILFFNEETTKNSNTQRLFFIKKEQEGVASFTHNTIKDNNFIQVNFKEKKDLERILNDKNILICHINSIKNSEFRSDNIFQLFQNFHALNSYIGKIVDLNSLISSSIKNNFNDLLLRFKKNYAYYSQTKLTQDLSNDSTNNKNFKIKKMINLLNNYFENKKILGLNDDLEKIQFVDLNNSKEDKKDLKKDYLSEGEKILFALANEFLETKQKNKIYIWDEMENHLHPKWQSKILSFIKEAINDSIFIGSTHSQVIIPQAFLDKDISLLKLSRENAKIILSETNLKEDQELKNAFNLNSDFVNKLKNIVNDTIFVEGKSDKIYLEKFLTKFNITYFEGGNKHFKIFQYMQYINHILGNFLFLLDNDYQKFKKEIEAKKFFITKQRIHFLKDLKYGKSIEYYFKDLFKDNTKIQVNNKIYQIIKDFDKFWEENQNLLEKNKINKVKIKNQMNKSGFLFSDSFNTNKLNQKFTYNQKEILLFSKINFANYLMQNKEKEVKEKLTPLLNSLEESLKK